MSSSVPPPMFRSLPPPAGLAPFVRRILIADNDAPVDVTVRPAPTGFNYVGWIFSGHAECDFGDRVDTVTPAGLHYAGQVRTPRLSMRYLGTYGHVLAETTATGFSELTRVAGEDIADDAGQFDTARHAWAAAFAERVETLPPDLSPDDRVAVLVAALTELAKSPMIIPDYVKAAAHRLTESFGLARINELIETSGVGPRHFTREFTRVVGVSPKVFALVQQINQAFALWQRRDVASLTELAHAAGYYDQPHLNRSFRKFFLESPKTVFGDPQDVVFEFLGQGATDLVQDSACD